MPRASIAWQHGFDELTPETAFIFASEPEIGFTAVDFSAPDAGQFSFNPPPGAAGGGA